MGRTTVPLLGVVFLALVTSVAAGQDLWPCGGFGCGPWYGQMACFGWYPWGGRFEKPPYYALNPPVYYTCPVSRPYGYSPFAYSPYSVGNRPESGGPVTVLNVYLGQQAPETASKGPTAPRPLRVQNPFLAQAPAEENRSGQGEGKR
jgi:hypothetical protein